jgi:hypothetical protein
MGLIPDVTSQLLAPVADHALAGRWVVRAQSVRIKRHGKPDLIVSDNATGFPLQAMLTGAETMRVT